MIRAVIALSAVTSAGAILYTRQPPSAAVLDSCSTRLIPYAAWPDAAATPTWSLLLDRTRGGGALHYVGAIHSRVPADSQFSSIRRFWREFQPTIAFYEGPDRGVGKDDRETITNMGESGYVRLLASRDGVKISRLEPDPREEVAHLLERFTPEQVKLFFVLREAQRLRQVEGLSEQEIKPRIAALLERAKVLEGIGGIITTVEQLEDAYGRHWISPAEWWLAPSSWFDPLLSTQQTGGIFTNDVNRASSELRNLHMFRSLASAAISGERVFAVVGRNHVAMQAAALQCALEPPEVRHP